MASQITKQYKSVKLHYNCCVPEDCDTNLSPIIFLHGLMSNSATWNKVKCKIADQTKRKIYTLDARNHGKSEWCDEFSLQAMVNDLEEFVLYENIPKFILVGHSLGGKQAMGLALHKPQMVEKLIVEEAIISRVSHDKLETFKSFFKLAKQSFSRFPPNMNEKDARNLIMHLMKKTLPQGFLFVANQNAFLNMDKDNNGSFRFLFNAEVLEKVLDDETAFDLEISDENVYTGPTLFLHGKDSFMEVEKDVENIMKHFPNAELLAIEDGCHILHAECSDSYVRHVVTFIQRK